MKKYILIIFLSCVFVAGIVLIKLWIESPESIRILFDMPTESPLRDNSTLVEYVSPGLPSVQVVTVDRKKLLSDARIKYMRKRREEAKKFVDHMKSLNRPTAIVVNLTTFGSASDFKVGKNEKGSVSRVKLRTVNTKKVRGMAWFMPEYSEENPDSPIKVPSVETWLGGGAKTQEERIANANKALANYVVEVTSLDESGRIIAGPMEVIPTDRGPNTRFKNPRADAYYKTWSDLGVIDKTLDPNSDDHKVTLVVSLIPKKSAEVTDGGTALPSWNRVDDNETIASNP